MGAMTQKLGRRGLLKLGVGGTAFLLSGARRSQAAPPVKRGGTFVYAAADDFNPLAPAASTNHLTHRLVSFMHEGLVRENLHDTKSSSLKVVPWLAESWEISSDGLQYTFKLRQNVKFHDGTPFDADAVKANFDRLSNPSSPLFDRTANGIAAQILTFVAKGEVIDKYTWRYTLKGRFGEFIRLLADRILVFTSPTALQKYGNQNLPEHPTGTGPFKFVERMPGQRVVLEKNPDYWGGAPNLDKVIISIIKEPQARVAALQSGEVDMVLEMLPDQVGLLRRDPKVAIVSQPLPHIWFWMLNNREGPTADKRVRQAFNYAWNRNAMTRDLLKGLAVPAISPAPPNNPAHPPTHKPYTYDPDKAKALLKQAGRGAGFEMTLMFPEATGGGQMQSVAMNELLQSDLKKVGINVKFDMMESTAFLTKARAGLPPTHGAMQTNWTTNAQLGFWLEQMFSKKFQPPNGNNRAWYANDEAEHLMDAARSTDPVKSAEAYRTVLDVIVEDAPWLWVVHDKNEIAIRKRVKGLDICASPYFDLQPVWIEG